MLSLSKQETWEIFGSPTNKKAFFFFVFLNLQKRKREIRESGKKKERKKEHDYDRPKDRPFNTVQSGSMTSRQASQAGSIKSVRDLKWNTFVMNIQHSQPKFIEYSVFLAYLQVDIHYNSVERPRFFFIFQNQIKRNGQPFYSYSKFSP